MFARRTEDKDQKGRRLEGKNVGAEVVSSLGLETSKQYISS